MTKAESVGKCSLQAFPSVPPLFHVKALMLPVLSSLRRAYKYSWLAETSKNGRIADNVGMSCLCLQRAFKVVTPTLPILSSGLTLASFVLISSISVYNFETMMKLSHLRSFSVQTYKSSSTTAYFLHTSSVTLPWLLPWSDELRGVTEAEDLGASW